MAGGARADGLHFEHLGSAGDGHSSGADHQVGCGFGIKQKSIEILLRKPLNLSSFCSVVHDIHDIHDIHDLGFSAGFGHCSVRSLGCAPVSPVLALLG